MSNQLLKAINAIRVVGVEAVAAANSGHPGIVLGAAPILATLFANHINFDVKDPHYFNRDRFVLSAGHGSALLYALFAAIQMKDVHVGDLKNFRQLNSVYAGHPERNHLPGVEMTTGPLGQGVGAAVGMAIAEAHLSALFKANNQSVVDHYTYCLFGDGDFQEGIFHEALSVAAYYNLSKLILIYDSNNIQLDGPTSGSEILDHQKYFEAFNIDYHLVTDGDDPVAIDQALQAAKAANRPSVIEVKTVIGAHSPKANSSAVHGAPLSAEEIVCLRENLEYTAAPFSYDAAVYQAFDGLHTRTQATKEQYQERLEALATTDPEQFGLFNQISHNEFDLSFTETALALNYVNEASRNIVGDVYQLVTKTNPTLITLNADLSVSTKIIHKNQPFASATDHAAPNWNMGVRELAMQAINNGISAHGGVLAAGSTFLAFADYTKPAIRLGAINELNTLTVFSHDSITVGEDGPTHQPIEQLAMLRATPHVYVARPSNVAETTAALELWLQKDAKNPVVITSSRAPFKIIESNMKDVRRGAYVIYGTAYTQPDVMLYATGSEVELAVQLAEFLETKNLTVQVVSFWCTKLFDEQDIEYKKSILQHRYTFSLEFGATLGWKKYARYSWGIDRFGLSAPAGDVVKALNFLVEKMANRVLKIVQK
ncbi:transketolase [Mycoplasmoides fastidiosum]|uniref:Transketolase n=1 Tax=Mycoplasmoides fastidiosum TaxID=92758 RepID=A0ABU0M023_9BACT|nr:transketolase [Mycoplasmoides fastidiosum]MDQ0514302.1 transketolase [Mycoplasmoides fastidiosum]UUD38094.1 transketolase [Mycoplasmoides fastidiosum]